MLFSEFSEHCHSSKFTVVHKAGTADRVSSLKSEKVNCFAVEFIPLQFGRNILFFNEHFFPDFTNDVAGCPPVCDANFQVVASLSL